MQSTRHTVAWRCNIAQFTHLDSNKIFAWWEGGIPCAISTVMKGPTLTVNSF